MKGDVKSIRFDVDELKLAKERSGIESEQKLVDYLVYEYNRIGVSSVFEGNMQKNGSRNEEVGQIAQKISVAVVGTKKEEVPKKELVKSYEYFLNQIPYLEFDIECNNWGKEVMSSPNLSPKQKVSLQMALQEKFKQG